MRREALRSSLILLLALALSSLGSALAEEKASRAIRGRKVAPVRTGVVGVEAATQAPTTSVSGEEPVPVVIHPPLPVPELPVPEGWGPPAVADQAPVGPQLDLPQAPLITGGFPGLDDSNGAIPPDTHGAVGPTKVMTTLNTQVQAQNRAGVVQPGWPVPLKTFWSGITTAPALPVYGNVFDPRVHFDPDPLYGGRWIWVACQRPRATDSGLLIAASTGPEPVRGPGALFDADPADMVWADYPSVGFNKNWVVVQVNLFSMTNPYPFVRSEIYVFRKDQLYAGTVTTVDVFTLDSTSCEGFSCGGTQVPAATYDFTQNDLYLVQRWNSGSGALRLYKISGTAAAPTLDALLPLVFGPPWAESEPSGPGADFAPQPSACGGAKIQTNDARIQNVVYRNGRLWATHTVFLPSSAPTRAAVQWWQIQTDSTVVQRGLVDGGSPARFYAFPSIAVNKNEDVLLGFSSFSDSEFASAQYTFRLATDPPDSMQAPNVLQAGKDCYDKDFTTGRVRWGDYSATVVDPTDDTKMWTVQEYAEMAVGPARDDSRWGTRWGMLDPTPAIAITDAFVVEGDSGTTPATFDLTLSVPTSQAVTVTWATANGSATTGDNDYVGASGTVVFAPGETAKTVTVAVKGDIKKEGLETFVVNFALGAPVNATLPDTQAVGSIANDDPDPQISIGDKQVLEGSSSGPTPAVFLVTLSNPSSSTVTVNFSAAPGTATIGAMSPDDLNPAGGTLTFNPGVVELPVTVNVLHDTNVEGNETFFVNLSSPLPAGVTILKGTGNGVILNDDPAPTFPDVSFLTVVSDGGSTSNSGRNRLQWLNPVTTTATQVRIRQNKSTLPTACTYPANAGDGSGVANLAFGGSGATQSYSDTGLDLGDAYCYSVFIEYPSSNFSSGANAQGRPFNAVSGKTRWKYFTGLGATTVAPPTVGTDGVLVPSNDNYVHGMTRGTGGGPWPTAWKPANLGSPAQSRSPIVPFAGGSRAFYSTLDGWVHAIDAKTGAILWETQIGTALQTGAGGAPAGIFVAYGGDWDYILVGTRQSAGNKFYALDPLFGTVIDSFPSATEIAVVGEIGAVTGMAAVDYARGQVYFGTFLGATNALWCLKLGPPSDALQRGWEVPRAVLGNIDGSPVTRGDRVYVGTTAGLLWSIRATDGLDRYSHTPVGLPEPIKGFPFPDRGSQALYFTTTTRVQSAVDNGAGSFLPKWSAQIGLTSPSPVLFWAAQDKLYVGMESWGGPSGAWLYEMNGATGAPSPIQLESGTPTAIGAPSLDTGVTPVMLHAGSVAGVIYAVQVP